MSEAWTSGEPVHGNMQRDECPEWPADEPVGSFDISTNGLKGYPQASGHIIFVCPNGKRCVVLLGPQAVAPTGGQRLHIWAWDGNLERPTLTPSINCLAKKDGKPTGGCGWHGFITAGVIR
jgi:hypothetical protein